HGQIVVGMLFTLLDEVGQFRVLDSQRFDLLSKLMNQRQLGVLIWLRKGDIQTDHSDPISRQQVYQSSDLGPGPRPASFGREAFFIDYRHHDRWRRWHRTTRDETEVVGFQFDQVEDGSAGEEEQDDEEDGAKG